MRVLSIPPPYDLPAANLPEGVMSRWEIPVQEIAARSLEPIEKFIEFGVELARLNGAAIRPARIGVISSRDLALANERDRTNEVCRYFRAAMEKYPMFGVLLEDWSLAMILLAAHGKQAGIQQPRSKLPLRTLITEIHCDLDPQAVRRLIYRCLWDAESRWIQEFTASQVGIISYQTWHRMKKFVSTEEVV